MDTLQNNWKKIVAVVLLGGLIYFMVFHWGRFLADFWPFDSSRVGPNIVAAFVQYAVLAILIALVYPPVRRAIERWAQNHVDSIKTHITAEHAKLHEKLDVMHAKQNHIIKYTKAIPNEVPGLSDEHQPT